MKKHYIGMAGLHGYLPDYCASYDSYEDAATGLSEIHELGKKRTSELKRSGYIELNVHRDGNEYAEIVECACSDPSSHDGM